MPHSMYLGWKKDAARSSNHQNEHLSLQYAIQQTDCHKSCQLNFQQYEGSSHFP